MNYSALKDGASSFFVIVVFPDLQGFRPIAHCRIIGGKPRSHISRQGIASRCVAHQLNPAREIGPYDVFS